jgi:hypothetical protein
MLLAADCSGLVKRATLIQALFLADIFEEPLPIDAFAMLAANVTAQVRSVNFASGRWSN